MIVVVGDGLDRPKKIKRLLEIQGFGVHQKEPRVQLGSGCRLSGHFHLHWGDCDANRAGFVLLCQVNAATPQPISSTMDPVWTFANSARCSASWSCASSFDSSPRIQ